jgi:kynurenine formamidase
MSNDWIDISVPIHTGMVHWPDNPPMRVEYLMHMERGDEGLDLSQVDPGIYELACLPIKITGSDGGPARAILRKMGGEA